MDRVSFASLSRRTVLQGLGVFLLAGCASMSRSSKPPAAKTASSQDPSRPKTVGEFVKQQPASLPFNDKE